MKPYMVDCLLDPKDWDLSLEDLNKRVLKPMLASLHRHAGAPTPEQIRLHMRLWVAPLEEWQTQVYDNYNEEEDEAVLLRELP